MAEYKNRVNFRAVSAGTGNFVVASAIVGYRTPAQAGVSNGIPVTYVAESDDLSQWEVGLGTYNSGTLTITRSTIRASSNSGLVVNFSAAPKVFIDLHAEEISAIRRKVSSNENFYVSTSGNDVTGLGTASSPWATLQHAVNYVSQNIDISGYDLSVIMLAAGTYAGCVIPSMVGGGSLSIYGNSGTETDYIITGFRCFSFFSDNTTLISFDCLTFQPESSAISTFAKVRVSDFVTVGRLRAVFNTAGARFLSFNGGARYNSSGPVINIVLNVNMTTLLFANDPGTHIEIDEVTLSGTANFTTAFAWAISLAEITSTGAFTGGTITGKRFLGDGGANFFTLPAGNPNHFPGNVAGQLLNGASYQ